MNPSDQGNPLDFTEPAAATPRLGSLAQAARVKQFKQSKGILIALGILMVLFQLFSWYTLETQVEDELKNQIRELQRQGLQIDETKLPTIRKNFLLVAQLITLALIGMGVTFIVLGLIVHKFPVPATTIALTLYLGVQAVFGWLDPNTIWQGIILKFIIVVALVKALQAAVAYKREMDRAAEAAAFDS